jgi:hypothetical protein
VIDATDVTVEAGTRDRAFFDRQPGAEFYWCPLMPGDLGLPTLPSVANADGVRVQARSFARGVRMRVIRRRHLDLPRGTTYGQYLALVFGPPGNRMVHILDDDSDTQSMPSHRGAS